MNLHPPANPQIKLWPHQIVGREAIHRSIDRGDRSGLIDMPTGSGKTTLFATVGSDLGWPMCVLVHRDELVGQTIETFENVWPETSIGVIKSTRDEWQDDQQIVIASVQTLRNGRLSRIPKNRFGFIVADECHHAVAPTWKAILEHFNYKYLLGCTATPSRLDGQGLDELFGEKPIYSYPLRSAIKDGVLVSLRQYCIETFIDLSGVSTRCGDYVTGELSNAINVPARNRIVVDTYLERCHDRRAVVFAVDVNHAMTLRDLFLAKGITSATVTGNTPIDERRAILKSFRLGEIQVVCNCQVLTEGFDDRGIGAILMARPTQSRGLYTQCIGRGLRKFEGKTDCIVLDFADNSHRHKLITCLDLFGQPKSKNADGADVVEFVDRDIENQQRRLIIKTQLPLSWRLERVCPWPTIPTLQGYVDTKPWHKSPASEKQVAFLHGTGLETARSLTRGEASYLIDRMLEYKAEYPDPPSPKQKYFLQSRKRWSDDLSFNDAKKLIGKIKGAA